MKYLYHNTLPLYFNGFVLGLRGIQLFRIDGSLPATPDSITPLIVRAGHSRYARRVEPKKREVI